MEFQEFIVQKDDSGVWRKCPYCGSKVWDGPMSQRAPGFTFHLTTKIGAHNDKPDWKARYGKDAWHLGTQKTDEK